jgi:hypothetical protein
LELVWLRVQSVLSLVQIALVTKKAEELVPAISLTQPLVEQTILQE